MSLSFRVTQWVTLSVFPEPVCTLRMRAPEKTAPRVLGPHSGTAGDSRVCSMCGVSVGLPGVSNQPESAAVAITPNGLKTQALFSSSNSDHSRNRSSNGGG